MKFRLSIHNKMTEEDVELEVDAWVSAYFPARRNGPPEYCCEEEGGEVLELHVYQNGTEVLTDLDSTYGAGTQQRIEDAARDAAMNQEAEDDFD